MALGIARAFIQTSQGRVFACGYSPSGFPYTACARVIDVGQYQIDSSQKEDLWQGALVYNWTFGGFGGRPACIDYVLSTHLRGLYDGQLGAVATTEQEREFYKRAFGVVERKGFGFLLFPRDYRK